jgi:hypothetical protein
MRPQIPEELVDMGQSINDKDSGIKSNEPYSIMVVGPHPGNYYLFGCGFRLALEVVLDHV